MADPAAPHYAESAPWPGTAGDATSIEILQAAIAFSEVGVWFFDLTSRQVWFSPVVFQQLGVEPDAFEHSFSAFDAFVFPEYYDELKTSFGALVSGESSRFCVEMQVRRADGVVRWIESTARRVRLSHGDVICGSHVDVTERRATATLLAERAAAAEGFERRFTELAKNIPGAIFQYILHPNGEDAFGYVSSGCELIWEVDADSFAGDTSAIWDMALAEDRPALKASIVASAARMAPWRHQWRIVTPSGAEKHLEGRGLPTKAKGGAIHWNSLVLDVTDQVLQRKALAETQDMLARSHERLASAIEALPDGFILYDQDDRVILYNSAFLEQHAGMEDAIQTGATARDIIERAIDEGLYDTSSRGREGFLSDLLAYDRSGDITTSLVQMTTGRWVQRRDRCLPSGERVGLRTDVSKIKAQEELMRVSRDAAADAREAAEAANARAEYEASHDYLTDCSNRRGLMSRLKRLDQRSSQDAVWVFSIDLDRFKNLNDTYGHAAGDAALKHVVRRIRSVIRADDFLARKGGDEFVMIIKATTAAFSPKTIADKVIKAAAQPFAWEGGELKVGVSIGYAPSAPGVSAETQLSNADMALSCAKEEGRRRSYAFSPPMADTARTRLALAHDFKIALENGEIAPFFQPQIDARTGQVRSVEALARWRHPARGFVSPAEFIPIAEELKLTGELDQQIFHRSVASLRTLRAAGVSLPAVSVNVSSGRLYSGCLMNDVAGLSQDLARSLIIEVLETAFITDDDARLKWTIDTLREAGASIELDDFGSGHASVASIMAIEPDALKLDQIFVRNIDSSPKALAVLRSLIGVARSFDVAIVAEGVETDVQRAIVTQEGCDVLQGFGLARPMPLQDLETWLRAPPTGLTA